MSFDLVTCTCDEYIGPPGKYDCVQLPKYGNIPQWATCLSNDYIRAKSHGRDKHYECVSNSTAFCWFQCMCETYGKCEGGEVYGDCVCDSDDKFDTTMSSQLALPSWCFSPDGKMCSWYRECLQELYPCKEHDAENSVTYAKAFCELYSKHQTELNPTGQRWVDVVRSCLQIELVPIFRPWATGACDRIKTQAFASHGKCYGAQTTNVSFCSLNLHDQLTIFWTVKGAFSDGFVEPVNSLWDMFFECVTRRQPSVDSEGYYMALLQIFVRKSTFFAENNDRYAGQILDAIAKQQKWEQTGISWFGYKGSFHETIFKENMAETIDLSDLQSVPKFRIDAILGIKHIFDLNYQNVTKVNMTDIVMSLEYSMDWGDIWLDSDTPAEVLSINVCGDINCNFVFLQVTSPLYNGYTLINAASKLNDSFWFKVIFIVYAYFVNYNYS